MACKISTLVLEVYHTDFCCCKCRKEITKALCKLQEKEPINSIIYDDKNNTVTIAGPFDSYRVSMKIKCKLSKMIKSIKPVEEKEEEEKKRKKEEEEEKKKKIKPAIVVTAPYWPAGPCCHMPYILSFHGGCRCYTCGWMSGAGPVGPPMFYPQCYREKFSQCCQPPSLPYKFFCEEYTPATCCMM